MHRESGGKVRVKVARADLCMFGMTSKDKDGEAPAKARAAHRRACEGSSHIPQEVVPNRDPEDHQADESRSGEPLHHEMRSKPVGGHVGGIRRW